MALQKKIKQVCGRSVYNAVNNMKDMGSVIDEGKTQSHHRIYGAHHQAIDQELKQVIKFHPVCSFP